MLPSIILMLFAVLPTGHADSTLPWADVRTQVAKTICAVADPDMPHGYWVSIGDRETCGLPSATHPLERAIDSALEQSRPLLASVPPVFSMEPRGLDAVYAAKDPVERNRLAAQAYLQDEGFLKALLPRLQASLRKEGLSCTECPTFGKKTVRRIKWNDFFPYVSAFVSPDPVHTPTATEGPDQAHFSFHICSGLPEVMGMKNPDPVLLRAGFVATFPTQAIRERTAHHFGEMLREEAFGKLGTDHAKTYYLREHLVARLRKDPAVQAGVCSTLAEYSRDVGVELADCPAGDK